MSAIKLSEAFICFNCDTIFSIENPRNACCPACTSNTYSRLSAILDRTEGDNSHTNLDAIENLEEKAAA